MTRKARYPLNLPPELYQRIKLGAVNSNLSVNEFIVRTLQGALDDATVLEQRVSHLERRVKELTDNA